MNRIKKGKLIRMLRLGKMCERWKRPNVREMEKNCNGEMTLLVMWIYFQFPCVGKCGEDEEGEVDDKLDSVKTED
jgi:hypothetical protein